MEALRRLQRRVVAVELRGDKHENCVGPAQRMHRIRSSHAQVHMALHLDSHPSERLANVMQAVSICGTAPAAAVANEQRVQRFPGPQRSCSRLCGRNARGSGYRTASADTR